MSTQPPLQPLDPPAMVVGEALMDVIVDSAGDSRHPGGSPANVAYGLGRLGRRTILVTELGEDADGAAIRAHLTAAGVDVVTGGDRPPRATGSAIATLAADGSADYRFELTWALTRPSLPEIPLVLHTGSLAATVEPGATTVERLVSRSRRTSTISYDPNIRPALMGAADDIRPKVERMVASSDVVKASDQDTHWLYPGETALAVAHRWLTLGPAIVVVTLGHNGAVVVTRRGETHVPAITVDVADTVGAGDAFTAGLLDGLWRENLLGAANRSNLHDIGADVVADVVHHASLTAAVTVSRPGANPPTRGEIDDLLDTANGGRKETRSR